MTKLIQGLYPLQGGIIKYDGIDIREIDRASLRSNIGIVLQDNYFVHGTVRENLALTKPQATMEEIIYSARMGVYVTASLYLPKHLKTPAASVLFLSGHTDTARMNERYQKVCQILVHAGLIVFAIDPVGQGERRNFYDPATDGYTAAPGVEDHDWCGVPSLCTGRFIES